MGSPRQRSSEPESAEVLAVVLDAVYDGRLTADGPAAAALVRHLEGALIALQVLHDQGEKARDSGLRG